MSENKNAGITLQMALVDLIPVVLFAISMLLIANRFDSVLFLLGAVCSCLAGLGKVLWKLIIALFKQELDFLAMQFKYSMSIGFICMLSSVFFNRQRINGQALYTSITSLPSVACFAVALLGMLCMIILAVKMDQHSAKANWLEQCLNIVIQGLVLAGILLLK